VSDPGDVLDDLLNEGDELDRLVAGLAPGKWAGPTPAPGWTVAHQIAHLAWTDEQAVLAATDPEDFNRQVEKALASPGTFVDEAAEQGAAAPPAELLERWRDARLAVQWAFSEHSWDVRVPWFGPSMSVASMVTGRLMETWAHGQDVADALGVERVPTARLRHVARIGVRARNFAFSARSLEPPAEDFRVELTGPGGEFWTYGPEGAAQRVTGPALDFCLLVTQRAHRADFAVRAEGPDADRWLDIAQSFAGPPGQGREPSGGSAAPKAGGGA
jgi:uncharacterized protein (TIGR03084 family)